MEVKQLYTNCLAEAAYYIESNGEAAIIDPIRETEPYLALLAERGTKLKYVFETHFHADFVSGHIDLAAATGAQIVFGPEAHTAYKVHNAIDGEIFTLGNCKIKTLHTPGHTPESTCYLLMDESGKDFCIFTGDTLFVGDVGRPDLLDGKMSSEELAGLLYDSLNSKIKCLADSVIVYPAHGPGSSCGKNIGKETWSTIGQQKISNYALADQTKESFIQSVTYGLGKPPAYFFEDAKINKQGYKNINKVIAQNLVALDLSSVEKGLQEGAIILDTRHPDEFEKGFIPGSINIGLNGQYAIWAGTLLPIHQKIILLTEKGQEEESIMRLARVGYENILGFITGGVAAWASSQRSLDKIESITPEELANSINSGTGSVLDVRKIGEYEGGHVQNAIHANLADIEEALQTLEKNHPYMIHCAGGYRSMIAASWLKRKGFTKVKNVYGGFSKIKETNVPLV